MAINSLNEFYSQLLGCIKTYGLFTLKDAHGHLPWPKQGVYFFFDPSEPIPRPDLPGRIVRIGSHGVARNTKSTLWGRLKQHQGFQTSGGGHHRGSIFRLYVGSTLKGTPSSWKDTKAKYAEVRQSEHAHECLVSDYIRRLPFTVIGIPGTPGKESQRATFERECIAYISWAVQKGLIKMGKKWLGLQSEKEIIKTSGLWNDKDVWRSGQPQPCIPVWPAIG